MAKIYNLQKSAHKIIILVIYINVYSLFQSLKRLRRPVVNKKLVKH